MAANWQEKLRQALEENSVKLKQEAGIKRRVVETLEIDKVLEHIIELSKSGEYPLLSASLTAIQIGTLRGIANKAKELAEQRGWLAAWISSEGLSVASNSIQLSARIRYVHPDPGNRYMPRSDDQIIDQSINILAVHPIVRENDIKIEFESGPLNLPKGEKLKSCIHTFKYPGEVGTPDELAIRAIGMLIPHE